MATKIGGDQLRLEDFVKNPTPNGDWSSTLFTASLAAIKDLMSASGIPELSGTVRLWEIDPGIYFLHGGMTIYPGRNIGTAVSYDSILILSDFFQRNNYKYYIIYNTVGQITYGQARETGGSAIFSNITPFQGASEQYQGSVGTVPAPQAGDQDKFLRGNGTWGEPDVFDGATALAAGQKGIVPAPQAGDDMKFLRGDKTWGFVMIKAKTTSVSYSQEGYYNLLLTVKTSIEEYGLTKSEIETIIENGGRVYFKHEPGNGDNSKRIFEADTDSNGAYFKNISRILNKLRISEYRMKLDSNNQEIWAYSQTEITI